MFKRTSLEYKIGLSSLFCYITVLHCDSASLRIMSDTLHNEVELVLLCVRHILGLDKGVVVQGKISDWICFSISTVEQ